MKLIKNTLPLLLAALLLTSSVLMTQDNPKKEIKMVAYNYLDAMGNYRIDDAVPYCTKETQDGVLVTGRKLVEMVQPGYIESDTPAKIKITDVELLSDTTAKVYYTKRTPIKKQNGEVKLVLRDGQWKVHIVQIQSTGPNAPKGYRIEHVIKNGTHVYRKVPITDDDTVQTEKTEKK
jgi:hypothetical protein